NNILEDEIDLLNQLNKKGEIDEENSCKRLKERLHTLLTATSLKQFKAKYPYTMSQMILYRYLFESKCRQELLDLLQILYKFDAFISIASVAAGREFIYPQAQDFDQTDKLIQVENLKHPTLKNAVGNDLILDKSRNLLFLTGANMAGKSTW